MELDDLFDIVIEPEHSHLELLMLEKKYNMTTKEFIKQRFNSDMPLMGIVPVKDIHYWMYQYSIYIDACEKEVNK